MNKQIENTNDKKDGNQGLSEYQDLLTVQDLRELTGLSEQTIRNLITSGQLPGCRIGRRLYVPKSRFVDFIEGGIN